MVRPSTAARPAGWSAHRTDLLSALTVVALLAPESVAYAQIAGVPAQYGLVAAPLTLLAYAVVGRSRVLAVGATAATAVITGATVAQVGADPAQRIALTAGLALLAGAILVVTGLVRCGFLARFLAPEALTGFLCGLAVVVLVRQAGVFTHVPAGPGDAFSKAWRILHALPQWHLLSVIVGVSTLVVLLVVERWLPRVPSTLVVLVVAWLVSAGTGLEGRGVAVVGPVPAIVPGWRPPRLPIHDWIDLASGALGLALVVFVMSYSVASRTAADEDPPLDANREMVAVGLANVLAGLVGGLASGGSPSASAAARSAGARSRVSAVTAAVVMLLVAAFCSPAFTLLPEPALAAVVVAAVRRFLAGSTLVRYLRRDRASLAVAVSALLGVLALDLLPGLLLAVGLSLALFVARASRLRVSELGLVAGTTSYLALERHPDATRTPGLVVLRPDGELFFANTDRVADHADRVVRARPGTRVLLLDLAASFTLELAVTDALRVLRDRLARVGVELWFCDLYLAAADAIARSELADVPAFADPAAAVEHFLGTVVHGADPQDRRPGAADGSEGT